MASTAVAAAPANIGAPAGAGAAPVVPFAAPAPGELQAFFAYLPDKTDADAFARRMAVRAEHFVRARELIANGTLRVGGGLLSPVSVLPDTPAEERRLVGSALVLSALHASGHMLWGSIADLYDYSQWDTERIVLLPFLSAAPLPIAQA